MKKILTIATVICTFVLFLTACTQQKTYEGEDEFGRTYGEIYDVDSQPTGVFDVPYEILDTSAMGKAMIAANCADYVEIEKTSDGYLLGFLCKSSMLGAVKMIGADGSYIDGSESERDGYQAFTFSVTREMLENKISLQCEVSAMNKTVEFSVKPDLDGAILAG